MPPFLALALCWIGSSVATAEVAIPQAWKSPIEFNARVGNFYIPHKRAVMEVLTYGETSDGELVCRFGPVDSRGRNWEGLPLRFRSPGAGNGEGLAPEFDRTLDFEQRSARPDELRFLVRFTRGRLVFSAWARFITYRAGAGCPAEAQVWHSGSWVRVENVVATISPRRHILSRGGPRQLDDVERIAVGTGRTLGTFREIFYQDN